MIITVIKAPDIDGLKFIKKLRRYDYHTPIIVVSEHTEYDTLIEIANLSVDAFLDKPLTTELLIKSIYNSSKRNLVEDEVIILDKHLVFNLATQELYLHNSIVTLGLQELQLLLLLIKNRSETISKEEIEAKLWPFDSVSDSAVKKLILRIRKKLTTDIIVAVRGVGYRLDIKETNTIKQSLDSTIEKINVNLLFHSNGDSTCQ